LAEPLDPDLLATIAHLRAAGTAPQPEPAFVAHLEEDLMHAFVTAVPGTVPLPPVRPTSTNGLAAPYAPHRLLPVVPSPTQARRWALGPLATAALILLALAAVYVAVERPRHDLAPAIVVPARPSPADAMPMRGADPAHTNVQPGPGPAGTPSLLWRVPLKAGTWEIPVADNVAYVCDDGATPGGASLRALDTATGAELWHADVAAAGGCQPPALAGGTAYFGGGKFVVAFDATTGTERWRVDVGAGDGSAPVIVDGVVYVGSGASPGAVYALDAATGKQRWRFATDGTAFADPAVANGIIYAATGTGGLETGHTLYAIDAKTGQERWHADVKGGTFGAPAVANGVVYLGNSFGLFAFDAATGQQRWHVSDSTVGAPAVADGVVYQIDHGRNLRAFDAATGHERWRVDINPSGRIASGLAAPQPTIVDGVIYAGSPDHDLYAIEAATGTPLWRVTTDDEVLDAPTVLDGVIYVGIGGAVNHNVIDALATGGTSGTPAATPGT
jgi:outer membrane protein assembly factor BamB